MATADLDPLADGSGPYYSVKVDDVSPFAHPPVEVISDVLPTGTMVESIAGKTLILSNNVLQYVTAKTNYDVVANSGTYVQLSGAVLIDLTVFAAASAGMAADAPEISGAPFYNGHTTYQSDLHYLLDQQISGAGLALPAIITVGNEENDSATATCPGSNIVYQLPGLPTCTPPATPVINGDLGYEESGVPSWYTPKLNDTVIVAHSYTPKIPVGDSGTTIHGVEVAYWNYLFNTCTPTTACQMAADEFQQWGFAKSAAQHQEAENFPTTCSIGSPLPRPLVHLYQRAEAIWADDASNHVDYANIHYYDVPWIGFTGAMAWVRSEAGGIPLMANEIGSYHETVVNTVAIMAAAQQLGFVYADWWNQSGADTNAVPLTSDYKTLLDAGGAWLAFRGFICPSPDDTACAVNAANQQMKFANVMTGPGPRPPLCPGDTYVRR